MKNALILFLFSLTSCFAVDLTEPKGRAFDVKMPVVDFVGVEYPEVLEFFRSKATVFLHAEMQADTEVVSFEYKFDPKLTRPNAKVNAKINYKARNVSVSEAMTATLHKFGLTYKIVSPTKVIIIE